MVKKFTPLALLIGLIGLLLAACAQNAATTPTPSGASTGDPAASGERALTGITQLILGTFKLEGTDQAVTAEQAAELLPLWQAYNALSTSDTAAKVEVEALETQIHDTMTAEQLQAISDMQLTFQDMMELSQSLGLSFGGRPGAQGTPDASGSTTSGRGAGEFAGGGPGGGAGGGMPPDGGGFPGGGMAGGEVQSSDPAVQATMQAFRASRQNAGAGANPMLLEALIKLLEGKIPPS